MVSRKASMNVFVQHSDLELQSVNDPGRHHCLPIVMLPPPGRQGPEFPDLTSGRRCQQTSRIAEMLCKVTAPNPPLVAVSQRDNLRSHQQLQDLDGVSVSGQQPCQQTPQDEQNL